MWYESTPKLDPQALARLQGLDSTQAETPTWRGWLCGFFACLLIGFFVPWSEMHKYGTNLAEYSPTPLGLVTLVVFILGFNYGLLRLRTQLLLTRQDLALVFCMMLLVSPLPLSGFVQSFLDSQFAAFHYSGPASATYSQTIHPYLNPALMIKDDPARGILPATWFFEELPRGQAIPWGALVGPYIYHCLLLFCVLGAFFALAAILHRQWSDRERLPFPLAQIPEAVTSGCLGRAQGETPFFQDPKALCGIGLVFLLHSHNALQDYIPNWPVLPLRYENIDGQYLTELKFLQPIRCNIYPALIGITYLISLEVSFSLWFFYFAVLKICIIMAIVFFGLGENGWYFNYTSGTRGIFTAQGNGALYALALASLFMARRHLWHSLRQALGFAPQEAGDSYSQRMLWTLLVLSSAGAVIWIVWAGLAWPYALLFMAIMLVSSIGVARLVAEGGIVWLEVAGLPAQIIDHVFSPVTLGPQNYLMVHRCNSLLNFRTYRANPLVNLMNSLQLAALAKMRFRPLLAGFGLAVVATLAVVFFTTYYLRYHDPNKTGLRGEQAFAFQANEIMKIQKYEEKRALYVAQGREIPPEEVIALAKTNWLYIGWMLVGVVTMLVFMFLRTRFFWWPHPIGYVMWMHPWPMIQSWFSYFLGWAFKAIILKFGGQRLYMSCRRFFVGMILGEALFIVVWILIAAAMGRSPVYHLSY